MMLEVLIWVALLETTVCQALVQKQQGSLMEWRDLNFQHRKLHGARLSKGFARVILHPDRLLGRAGKTTLRQA